MKWDWMKNKSNRTVIVVAVVNVVAAVTGYQLPEWFNEAALGIWAMFLRQGVLKSGPGA